jgi:hypothetical protein
MFAWVRFPVMLNRACIYNVGQNPSQRIHCERAAQVTPSGLGRPAFQPPAPPLDFLEPERDRTMRFEHRKDSPHAYGFFFIDDQASSAWDDVIAEQRIAAGPLSLFSRRGHLVARALPDQFALKLREREEDVQRQPSQRRAGVELLRDRREAHFVLLEDAQHAREVQQRPAWPVYFVHHHAIQLARFHRAEQSRQRRPVHVGAGETAVVI